MKNIIIALLILFAGSAIAQNASTYFPANTGYKWYYKNIPLDSNNVPQQNLARYRVDSFAVVANYKGLLANTVRIKDNLLAINQNTPYNDTNHYNFQTTNAWKYLSVSMLPDTIPLPGIMNFFRSLESWYSMYRFAQAVNSEYLIIQKDTTIAFDTLTIPLRAKVKSKRLADETVSTFNGNYLSKKFVTTFGLYVHLFIIDIPIIERPDTTWFAQDIWMVKEITPSVNVSLSYFGLPYSFYIPGNIYELTNPNVGIKNISSEVPGSFRLEQNYPNPFNPSTKIRFTVADNGKIDKGNVKLKIYDLLGKEVSMLVNEKLLPGTYEVQFNANGLTSGVYFYTIESGSYIETKIMMLLK